MSGRWERFCVVGVGGHARNRLIPAIRANDQILVGVVSRKQPDAPPDAPVFASIEQALLALPEDTVFVLATPPAAHFEQALAILRAGCDVFVEKPAFVTAAEAREAAATATRSGALLVEGFMNRHTLTHRRYLADWAASPPVAVECVFTIPEAPANTFRSESAIGSSNLYDIGAYFLAALLDAGLPLDALTLVRVDEPGRPDRERLHFAGELGGVRVRGLIGVDAGYANSMTLTRSDGTALRYEPFVYGRPGARRVIATVEGGEHETVVEDVNAFEAIFAAPRAQWRSSQSDRLDRMVELTRQLERLGRALAQFRADRP
ncbi:Gfo/Idh/MocA family protein [Brevundimonas sp.]|uniref:Gfo/Idh/MocA family protein n=1 Tax=Brevundimonas sp. TaxID=1871086 RepID=UPI002737AA3C|nr:Gfo/Idh/MocA family oxidoreductase [Brevundimonas sp.]MDP3802980.1 Gfo/Idh/MocA family oxidoreductase [Brevundimonas sp.]